MKISTSIYILTISLMAMACKSNESINGSEVVAEFPLNVGNSWTYNWTASNEDISEKLEHRVINIKIIGRGKVDGIETYEFETVEDQEPELVSIHHYFQDAQGLNLLAYKISAITDANARSLRQMGVGLASPWLLADGVVLSDDLILENPPKNIFNYPLEIGKEWSLWLNDGVEIANKTVVSFEEVSVPAGIFNCYKIEYSGPWYESNQLKAIEYVSNIGLVKRVITSEVSLTDIDGNDLGTKVGSFTIELEDYNIKN
ncbi:MAG: hypothetical protein ABJH98_11815 [Reichenbachiella sp.]|uniref:TapB family protein n=1 Tax=Reichenbachiella sp. TaxID=2184521 RepID=UPI003296F14B